MGGFSGAWTVVAGHMAMFMGSVRSSSETDRVGVSHFNHARGVQYWGTLPVRGPRIERSKVSGSIVMASRRVGNFLLFCRDTLLGRYTARTIPPSIREPYHEPRTIPRTANHTTVDGRQCCAPTAAARIGSLTHSGHLRAGPRPAVVWAVVIMIFHLRCVRIALRQSRFLPPAVILSSRLCASRNSSKALRAPLQVQ